ncbi:B-cell receptor-associated protein 29 isoform X1 [Syngnathoides biaculeatus]|uniref:B-cell receptor-associated protein 29 isoform X1 n=1 Tax=Syngnathoides biaculeatus TaxID=300417 RepID=UPI002ADE01BF|nr:B-cell receptor-associated protein 29 isoform X1 [Syngnathoides biaculeatus]XP_061679123.1 B-cell receptor-associated protein 29 isoform X1 [Syngnathoides biaculeatus]XP_061679124.1 B-cell receptor-associated protein 29 isoform X1 [Syngnathoides biaculeatus]
MTLQWTVVAFFLYAEIAVNLILCVPLISAQRWRSVFNWRIWKWLSPYWNKCFFTMIMVLVVLFLDATREVHKYSSPEPMREATANSNLSDHLHMRLFRAQRNLYISGFSLFLWLVIRRVIILLNQVAGWVENNAGLQAQMENAAKAVKQHQEHNRVLKQTLLDEEKVISENNQQLKLEVESLSSQLKMAEEVLLVCAAVHKSHAEVEAMSRQAKGLAQEYERLLTEHHQLQNLQSATDKKIQ